MSQRTLPERSATASSAPLRSPLRTARGPGQSLACWLVGSVVCLVFSAGPAAAEAVRRAQSLRALQEPAEAARWSVLQEESTETGNGESPQLPPPDGDGAVAMVIPADGLKPIAQLKLDIRPKSGELPPDAAAAKFAEAGRVSHPLGTSRPWSLYALWWQSSAFCHRPLYFEEVNLERYGYSYGRLQPLVSAAHFFGTLPILPYLLGSEPPTECIYTLGHYQPGSYAPDQIYFPRPSLKGALMEAAAVSGLIFALP